jgi:ParB-like chromosome segregation protein Spo0J
MVQELTKIVPLSRIQVSRSRLRRKNVAAVREAIQAIRKDGQQRPLIIDPDYQLLSDTTSYLALKALNYEFAKTFKLTSPSPTAIRAVDRLLDCCEAMRRQTAAFNAALASLGHIAELDVQYLVLELLPVVISDTGTLSHRVSPALASDADDRTPLEN